MGIFDYLFGNNSNIKSKSHPSTVAKTSVTSAVQQKAKVVSPFAEAKTYKSENFTSKWEEGTEAFLFVPLVKIQICCRSTVFENISDVTKFLLVNFNENVQFSELKNAIKLDFVIDEELRYMESNALIEGKDDTYVLTELGKKYADMILSLRPFENGIEAYLNLFTNEIETIDSDALFTIDSSDRNILQDNVLNNKIGVHLLKNENYSNSLELIKKSIVCSSFPRNLVDSLYSTVRIVSPMTENGFQKIYKKMKIPFNISPCAKDNPIHLYAEITEYNITYKSELVDKYRDLIPLLKEISEKDKQLLSETANSILSDEKEELDFPSIYFTRNNIVNHNTNNELLELDEIDNSTVLCKRNSSHTVRFTAIKGVRPEFTKQTKYAEMTIDYSQLENY